MNETWTPELVRQKLPKVRVEHNGRIIISKVCGRQNRFATVIIDGLEIEFAWTTIARTLNQNRTLKA